MNQATKKLIKKYNLESSLIVISGYPKKRETYSQGVCAVSSFAKNTLRSLQKDNPDRKIVVLTMEIDKQEAYEEDGLLVVRCFKRNIPLSYFNLLRYALTFNHIKNILIEFEFASFGDTFMTGLIAPLVWALTLFRKNVNLVIHQVLLDINLISGHIGVKSNGLKMRALNYCLKKFYKILTIPAKQIVVLEEQFKETLSKLIGPKKISVIPHGVDRETNTELTSSEAKKRLGFAKNDFVVLYFGYLTWYKGVDFLINALKDTNKINGRNVKLLIAGGPSFTQKGKNHYKRFVEKVMNSAKLSKNIKITGFVKEEDIPTIFAASDLSVLPYRVLMSASGPLSLALSFNKPFILSEKLVKITASEDFKTAMKLCQVSENDLFFKLTKSSLIKIIGSSMKTANKIKLTRFNQMLGGQRAFEKIAKTYAKIIFTEQPIRAYKLGLDFTNNL